MRKLFGFIGNYFKLVSVFNSAKTVVNYYVSNKKVKKGKKKLAKKAYKADLEYNEEIEIAKFVCDELNKFDTKAHTYSYNTSKEIYENGLSGLLEMNLDTINEEIAKAKALPRSNADEKELRKIAIEIAKNKKTAFKTIQKYFKDTAFVMPKYSDLQKLYDEEDALNAKMKELNLKIRDAKKAFSNNANEKNAKIVRQLKEKAKKTQEILNATRKASKAENDRQALFSRAAKPYLDAKKVVEQFDNYNHYDEINAQYEVSKSRHEAFLAKKEAELKELTK